MNIHLFLPFFLAWTIYLLVFFVPALGVAAGGEENLDTAKIERLTGVKGQLDETEHAFKVSAPRGPQGHRGGCQDDPTYGSHLVGSL